MRVRVRLAPWVGVLVAVVVACGVLGRRVLHLHSTTWNRAELALLDLGFSMRGDQPGTGQVVVVEVDDRTIRERPDLLERRAGNAELLDALHDAGASVVALDLFFTDPESLLPDALVTDLRAWVTDPEPDTPVVARALLERIHEQTVGDDVLEASIGRSKAILSLHVGRARGDDASTRNLTRGTYGQVVAGDALPSPGDRVVASLERFQAVAGALGVITVQEDDSGAVRAVALGSRVGPRMLVPLGFQAVAQHDGTTRGKLALVGTDDTARLGDRTVRGDDGLVWLNWRGRDQLPTISAVDVLSDGFDRARVAGRIVFVGYAHLASDSVRAPYGRVPGVQVHATLADNLIADDPLRRAPPWMEALLVLVCGGLVSAGFAWRGAGLIPRGAGILAGASLAAGVPVAALARGDLWVGGLGPVLAVAGATLGCVGAAWVQEGAQARALRRTFAHYVSDELIAVMVADPDLVQLKGQRRELSVLFSDIRDFTSYAERIPPLALAGFLASYLGPMTRAVFAHRGYVDKFIGDAVMALFGAPVPDVAHAESACRSALAMWVALDEVRPAARALGVDLAIGVGINSGEVAVGNMGSAERFEYTVLGDAVNLASRLEGLTKSYGVFCLIGPGTARALGPSFDVRRVDLVRVKGKAEPVEVFELRGEGAVTVVSHRRPELWDPAIDAWRRGDLVGARAGFRAFLEANPDDPVAALYLIRLDDLGEHAPDGWDGVFTHTRK